MNAKNHLAAALLAAAAIMAITASASAQTTIRCPGEQMRKEIVTPLPGGWWQTPVVNRLTGTRVARIGGDDTLVCEYGPAGSVMRRAPARTPDCVARAGGFRCRAAAPTTGAAPRTYRTGPLEVPQTYLFDLDTGTVGAGGDIWFQAVTATERYLTPRGGAGMSISGRRNRGLAGCSTARYSTGRISIRDIPVGTYVCVRTNEGRTAEFRVNARVGPSPGTLRIGYTTWAN